MKPIQPCSPADRASVRRAKRNLLWLFSLMLPFVSLAQDAAFSQPPLTLTGFVLDENKEPVAGANVRVKETNKGTATDATGRFTLEAPTGATLVVTFLGYEPHEYTVPATAKPIYIELKISATALREAVVQVGYGGVKRANLLGSVTSLKAREVEDLVTGNLATALQGRLAGVQIGQASGAPGASTSIQVRIDGSWNDEPPLFVIDGFVRDQAAFDILDPSEIEDISVLKDAAAAVYGARSAGGVFLVTTKRGKEGKAKVSYSATLGLSNATRLPETLSAYDHAVALNDLTRGYYKWDDDAVLANAKADKRSYFSNDELQQLKSLNYNWLDDAWKSALQTRHNIGISGGTNNVRYYAGGSYMYQNGNFDQLNMNKYTVRMSMDIDLPKGWLLSVGLNGNRRSLSMPYNDLDKEPEKMYNTYGTLLRTPKWLPPYINGLPVGQNTVTSHPMYVNQINSYKKSHSGSLATNLALQWELPWVKGLKARAVFDYLNSYNASITYAKKYLLYNFETVPTDYSTGMLPTSTVVSTTEIRNGDKYQQSANTGASYQLAATLDYRRAFGKHNVYAMATFEQSQTQGTELSAYVERMIIDNVEMSSAFGDGVSPVFNGRWSTPTGRQSLLGRFNYDYNETYLLESTLRYEASTRFAPEDRWGFFPSVSVGWRVSNEPFFQEAISTEWIDHLKLRASYGRLGNDNANPLSWENNYQYTGDRTYLGGSTLLGSISPNNEGLSMRGITWEKSDAYNAGLDLHFLNHFSLELDGFYRHNFDILQVRSSALSYSTGIGTSLPKGNYGIQDSWGGEVTLGWGRMLNRDWSFNASGYLSYATSKVIRKIQSPAILGTWKDEEGRIRGGETGYFCTGILSQADVDRLAAQYGTYVDATTGETKINYTIFGRQPEAGMLNFKDVGGPNYSNVPDGVIDENDERIISKYDNPPFHYGLTLKTDYKSFRLSATFTGQFGNDVVFDKAVYNVGEGNRQNFEWLSASSNNLSKWKDHWTPENPHARLPRLYNGNAEKRSTFWIRDGHTLTLRNVTLSYDLPRSRSVSLGIPSLRVYLSATNLWTIINPYDYKDPSLSSWMDYPIMRSLNLGINMTF